MYIYIYKSFAVALVALQDRQLFIQLFEILFLFLNSNIQIVVDKNINKDYINNKVASLISNMVAKYSLSIIKYGIIDELCLTVQNYINSGNIM